MTSTPAYGADRVGASDRPLRALSATPAIIVLLLGGLALRLTIAYVLFPSSGFGSDVNTYSSWATTMAQHAPGGFYANAGFVDYPPAYLYVLWLVGQLAQVFGGSDPFSTAQWLIKLPPILIDIAVGYALYRLVKGWAWPGRRAETLALIAAALYVFNPVTWYDSALWGQTDAAGALVLLLGVAALIRGNSEGAAGLAVVAALIKPQYGVVLIPLVAVLLLRRHFFHPGSGPRHAPWGPAWLRGWLAREQGWPRIVTSGAVTLVVFYLLALPFGMDIPGYLRLMGSTANGYAFLSVNAFNLWALFGSGGDTSLAQSMGWSKDTIPLLGPLSGFAIGAGLLVAGFLFGLFRAWRHDDRRTIILVAAFLCLCFFFLPTRVHERYLLPVFAFLPLLAAASRSWRVALLALAVGSFINLHAVLTIDQYGTPNVTSLPLGETFRSMPFILLSVVLQGAVLLFAAWRLRPAALAEPDGLDVAASQVAGWVHAGPVPDGIRDARRSGGPAAVGGASMPGAARPAAGPTGASAGPPASWTASAAGAGAAYATAPLHPDGTPLDGGPPPDQGRWVRGPGALAWLGSKIFVRPARRDRGAQLVGERTGRLDRMDLLLVVVIAVSAFGLRAYRVAEPYDMYFDEVYHARTAMEFLQDWRYGMKHSIYEYTHPHMAKYLMALGIEAFGDHRVTGQSDLGMTVDDAAVETRWSPSENPSERDGDRLYVATGSSVEAFDLLDRKHISGVEMDATAVAVDQDAHVLYIAGSDGTISQIDTTAFDTARRDPSQAQFGLPQSFATPTTPGRVTHLAVAEDSLISLTDTGVLSAFDLTGGGQTGERQLLGTVAIARVPSPTDVVVIKPADVPDPKAVARILAEDLGLDEGSIESSLRTSRDSVSLQAWLPAAAKTAVQGHIDDGTLPGVSITGGTAVAVSGPDGLTILDGVTLDPIDTIDLGGPTQGMALGDAGLDDPSLYIAAGDSIKVVTFGNDGPSAGTSFAMPGPVTNVLWNEPSTLFHAVGTTKDGTPTIYVIDPHGNANSVFEDVALPFAPMASVVDTQPDRPSDDRTQILALAADGNVASVDIGGNAWGYRLPGVLMGTLTAVCLYLLARLFFRRRSVAVFTAVLVLVEGMFFVNARIAMNDVYVTGFLTASLLLFAPLYLGLWRRPWIVAPALLGVGVLLGLALASKWVAAYAIGGMVLLVLLRSALGRLIALLGMIALTMFLGALAIRPADVPEPHRNWLFLFLMLGLTMALAAAMVRRPVRFTLSELRFAVVASLLVGGLLVVAGVVLGIQNGHTADAQTAAGLSSGAKLAALGALGIATGIGAWVVAWLGGRTGRGPLATHTAIGRDAPAPSPAPSGWLLPGAWGGLPWLFALACLVVVPVVVYIVSYIPWIALGNQWFHGYPAGNTGQTLWDLTLSMYDYHNNLRVGHPASSPWWAWPLDLKPVWFYQQSFANDTLGDIYDSGNPVIFWMSIPAMLFTAVAAWRRRSLPLTVIVLMFLAMWLPWVRIDRATFQYHYYSSLPFLVLALAYFLAELWHGPAHLAWVLARVGGALAILAPPILWLSRQPLCVLAGTASANAGGQACGPLDRDASISAQALVAAFVLLVGAGAAAWQIWYASRSDTMRLESGAVASSRRYSTSLVAGLLVTAAATLLALLGAVALFSADSTVKLGVEAGQLAVIAVLLLAIPAWMMLRARDSRRFAIGILGASVLWFILWYPNLTGLPLPNSLANVYLGLLPTWNYDFQFTVNMDPPTKGSILDLSALVIGVAAIVCVVGVMLVARMWSSSRGRERPADPLEMAG